MTSHDREFWRKKTPTNNCQWVDEDEQDEAAEDDYANNFGGFEGLDQGGLGNIDFSKLGANLGGGAEGAEGLEGAEGEESVSRSDPSFGNRTHPIC
jgi:hypothetical protein